MQLNTTKNYVIDDNCLPRILKFTKTLTRLWNKFKSLVLYFEKHLIHLKEPQMKNTIIHGLKSIGGDFELKNWYDVMVRFWNAMGLTEL